MSEQSKTHEILNKGQELQMLIELDGWKQAKEMLIEKIATLSSDTIETKGRSDEDIAKEVKERQSVKAIVLEWLGEVEGEARKGEFYTPEIEKNKKDELINYFK